ncbi:hypothetical protein E0Z10_g9087 [Xylaria hypoxylon]|uniref:Uncharacterized protein n=1 Tax=Xylaria hypoxylon TaxID=37992 RepID=A0A4Z0YKB5_9PEZI|nr:hypothetical protein E0Z10_g9087 [Xylaria hypoxylon]
MRPQLITLALTSSNLVSTNAAQQSTTTRNKGSSLQLHHEAGLTAGVAALERRTWASRSPLGIKNEKRDRSSFLRGNNQNQRRKDGNDGDDDSDDDEDDREHGGKYKSKFTESSNLPPPPTSQMSQSISQYTTPLAVSTSTTVSTSTSTLISTTTNALPLLTPTGASSGDNGGGTQATPKQEESHDDHDEDDDKTKPLNIAVGLIAGLLFLFLLLLVWYWIAVRRKRRDLQSGQHVVLAKDTDLESHVTVDLRNGHHTSNSRPHDAGSSSDELSSYTIPAVPVTPGTRGGVPGTGQVVSESAAHSLTTLPFPDAAHTMSYPQLQRTPVASSPATSHTSFMDAYATPHAAYPQGSMPPVFPPLGTPIRPLPLQIGTPYMHSGAGARTTELDGRSPPPRYPDAIATSQVPNISPTSPLPVSPLSVSSPREGPQAATHLTGEPQYHSHPQQYQGPRQPSYEGYEPSALPEVVSPICQLGQTSASLPEYDESAETAHSGVNNHGFVDHQGDEKQASQQPMSRY